MSLSPQTLHRLHRPLQDSTDAFLEALIQEASGLCEQDIAIDPLEVSDLFLKQLKSKLKGWKISNWDFLSRKAGTLEIDLHADSPDGKIKKRPHAGIDASGGKFSATYTLGRKDKNYSVKGTSLKDIVGKIVSGLGNALSGLKEADESDPVAEVLSEILNFCTGAGIDLQSDTLEGLVEELESWISYSPLEEERSAAIKAFVERLKKMIFTMLNKSKKTVTTDDEGELPGDAGDAGDDGEDDEEVDEAKEEKGEKVTIYHVAPLGGLVKTEGYLKGVSKSGVTFVPKKGRRERMIMSYYDPFWLVAKGWGHPDPKNPQRIVSKTGGVVVSKPKYGGVKGTIRHAEDFMATVGKDLKSKTMAVYQGKSLKTYGNVPTIQQQEASEVSSIKELTSDLRELSEKKMWIQKAIKKPGALRKALKAKEDEPIPAGKLKAAAKKPGKIGKRARLALTLKKLAKRRKK
jgi:hypothetical protein